MKNDNDCKLAILISCVFFTAVYPFSIASEHSAAESLRERQPMDFGWRFAFGHSYDAQEDYNNGTGYFSYFAKAGYGDGAAAMHFDDRTWRLIDLPHDWAVELPFSGKGSHSHGYKAIGRNFPETSVGWYRKSFFIPESDLGQRISIEFDGVFRNSIVWINGHYLGTEESGYSGFACNLTEFLNYGGNNVIAVRVDAAMEEGWFYEGAGIYRHVWLVKTAPLHVDRWGTFVTSEVHGKAADVTARVTIVNEGTEEASFDVEQTILDADGRTSGTGQIQQTGLKAGDTKTVSGVISVADSRLWSIETPYLYKLVTTIRSGGKAVDRYVTPFGIRTIRFDPDEGFFLNGRHVELCGTNNHQDHAGVGTAVPDALQDFRIRRLKEMGSNAYRCSHNPPTPELLDACDRLGMVVIDENRLMGTANYHLDHLKRMILRDRNHPSVVLWSLGNEEWAIEGNITGARITRAMQASAQRLDPTRRVTAAVSGGWGEGISTILDVMGYNYISHGSTDKQHAQFPSQPGVGTEETSTQCTRGIYFTDKEKAHMAPIERGDSGGNCEIGWKYYAARPYLAGLFYWTGFDYRGESNPFSYPAVSSQFGILDTCGFPKDSFYYLQSWWTDKPVLHLFPHWNWPGKEGEEITVGCCSNCGEVELFLNGRSLGKKTMEKNSHLEWKVRYEPGVLLAGGYMGGKEVLTDKVETTGVPTAVQLTADRDSIRADRQDVSVITIQVNDAQGRRVPVASNEITFDIEGPGKIIGVGNGDPSCHEPDVFLARQSIRVSDVGGWKWKGIPDARQPEMSQLESEYDDTDWKSHDVRSADGPLQWGQSGIFRCTVDISSEALAAENILLNFGMIDDDGWIYINGKKAGESHDWQGAPSFAIKSLLHPGKNTMAAAVANRSGTGGINKGVTLAFQGKPVPPQWKRSVFNGLAQVIVQSTEQPGEIMLTASSSGLSPAVIKIRTSPPTLRSQ